MKVQNKQILIEHQLCDRRKARGWDTVMHRMKSLPFSGSQLNAWRLSMPAALPERGRFAEAQRQRVPGNPG